MKKLIFFCLLLLGLPVALFAQGTGTSGGFDLGSYVSSFGVYVVSIGLLTNLLATFLVSIKRVFLSWGSAAVIAILAFILKLGIFYDVWYLGVIYLAIGGLVASAVITSAEGESIIDLIKRLLGKPNLSLKK